MPIMMTLAKDVAGPSSIDASIVLASDSDRHGRTMYRALREEGFEIEYAGSYEQLDERLLDRKFDVVLLEVTGEHAVEAAVAAALRVKRAHSGQFVGYLADGHLDASGLAGDAMFPRSAARLPVALRRVLGEDRFEG